MVIPSATEGTSTIIINLEHLSYYFNIFMHTDTV